MYKLLRKFWRHQKLSFFAAKVTGALYELGIDRRKIPDDPFNSFCDRLFEKAEPHEAAAAFFCENFPQFPESSYTLPIGRYDLIFRATKIIGIWRDKALMPATSTEKMISELEAVCRMIELQHPNLFANKSGESHELEDKQDRAHFENRYKTSQKALQAQSGEIVPDNLHAIEALVDRLSAVIFHHVEGIQSNRGPMSAELASAYRGTLILYAFALTTIVRLRSLRSYLESEEHKATKEASVLRAYQASSNQLPPANDAQGSIH